MISEKTGGAESFSFGLNQTFSVFSSRGGLAKFAAVRKIRELAKSEHLLELVQLGISCCFSAHGDDPSPN